ncbi:I78 family peptidase inhibitor [Pseudomonas sp. NPDC088368]|uniref:I78 family peptidase inhibitor n=1 Tax=Pseudomonas sp. NPDC088368 TaxID=3364453 RepID=UPI0037FF91F8
MPWKYASSGLILAVALLAGCSTTSESSSPAKGAATSDSSQSRCDAAAAQFAVGKPASPALLDQARAKAGAQTARVLGPDDMVTLEYRSDRLNLNTDQGATVTRVNCG